jgi:hypothetical protein
MEKYLFLLTLFAVLRWRHDLYEQCLGPVLEATVSAKPIPYSHILVLDSRVRDFYVPPELDMFSPRGLSNVRPLLLQQAVVSTALEISVYFVVKPTRTLVNA